MEVTKWNGKPIKKPGWYSGIPIERYHSAGMCDGPAVSSSNLRTCWMQSPAHMYDEWCENPDAEERKATRSMILGQAAHHLLLGEDHFKLRFVGQPELYRDLKTAEEKPWNNNANACKAWHAKQAAEGKTVVTIAELKSIVLMARSLALEPLVNDGLLSGYVETSGFFKDRSTGLWVKVRPDVVPTGPDFVDLKTAADVTTVALMSSIRSYGYHQQGALIWEMCDALEQPFESFLLLFIETARPHCARAVPLTDDDLARGRLQNRAMLKTIAGCMANKHWPGPGEGDMRAMPLSHDERARIDARLKIEGVA
jgi:hypothetical protein